MSPASTLVGCRHTSPCWASKAAAHSSQRRPRAAGEGSCCPDGFDCVARGAAGQSQQPTCQWTGRPFVPPAGFIAKGKPIIKGPAADGGPPPEVAQPRPEQEPRPLKPPADDCDDDAGTGSGRKLKQVAACSAACSATTLPAGCSRSGPRHQAPSCRCYDVPLNMAGESAGRQAT